MKKTTLTWLIAIPINTLNKSKKKKHHMAESGNEFNSRTQTQAIITS
jgi:hypothetical protein